MTNPEEHTEPHHEADSQSASENNQLPEAEQTSLFNEELHEFQEFLHDLPLKFPLLVRVRRAISVGLLWLFIASVVIGIGTTVLWQSHDFRSWFLEKVLTIANKELAGNVTVSDIGGNPLTGLELHGITVVAGNGDTVATIDDLTIRYDLQPLTRKNIVINRLILRGATIHILRSMDSVWNVERIAKPSSDTSASAPFDWTISVRDVSLNQSNITVFDSTAAVTPTVFAYGASRTRFDALHCRLRDVDFAANAVLKFAEKSFSATLANLSCRDDQSGFVLQHAGFSAVLDTTRAEIFNAQIQTPGTKVRLDAQSSSLNIFDGLTREELRSAPFEVNLVADTISVRDIQYFISDIDFMDKGLGLKIDAGGTLGNIKIHSGKISFQDNKYIALQGSLKDVFSEKGLIIDALIKNSPITYTEVQRIIPGISLPNLAYLGTIQLDTVHFQGKPRDFAANIKAQTAVGSALVTGKLDARESVLKYNVAATVATLNLAPILADSTFAGNLNASVEIEGAGTTLETLDSKFRIETKSSSLAGRSIKSILLSGAARSKIISLDTLHAVWDLPFFLWRDQNNISDMSRIDGKARVDMNPARPEFSATLDLEHFNIETVAPKSQFPTNFSGQISLLGRGLHLDSLEAILGIACTEFSTPKRTFKPFTLRAQLDRVSAEERTLSVTSDVIDAKISGIYRFSTLFPTFSDRYERLYEFIGNKYNYAEFMLIGETPRGASPDPIGFADSIIAPLDVRIHLHAKELGLLDLAIPKTRIRTDAKISARLQGTTRACDFVAESGEWTFIEFDDKNASVRIPAGSISGSMLALDKFDIEHFQLAMSARVDGLMSILSKRPGADTLFIGTPNALLQWKDNTFHFDSQAWFNRSFQVRARGTMNTNEMQKNQFGNASYEAIFDSLTVTLASKKELHWRNIGDIRAAFSHDGVDVHTLKAERPNAEILQVRGTWNMDRYHDMHCSLLNFPFEDVRKFVPEAAEFKPFTLLRGKLDSLGILLNGTPKQPVFSGGFVAKNLLYNEIPVGDQTATFRYEQENLLGKTSILLPVGNGKTVQTLGIESVRLPLNLAFESVKERMISGREIDIRCKADRVNLVIVQPFVPSLVRNLQGTASAEFDVRGRTLDSINYFGKVDAKASFTLESTNIKYFAEGKANLLNRLLTLDSMKLRNEALDLPGGQATVTGNVLLKGFSIDTMNLFITTPKFLVLSDISRSSSPNLYGQMVIANGIKPLHFYGSLDAPKLRGDMDVLSANIKYPEDKSIARSKSRFKYEVVVQKNNGKKEVVQVSNDPDEAQKILEEQRQFRRVKKVARDSVLAKFIAKDTAQIREKNVADIGFIDKLDCDVDVNLRGRFFVTMDFGPLEQLVAEVLQDDKLRFIQRNSVRQLFGSLRVKETSKYNFYRPFDVSGRMFFTSGSIENPNLELSAVLNGQRVINSTVEQFRVNMKITGTKKIPHVEMTYTLNGVEGIGDSSRIQTNAIMLLVFGKTQEELVSEGRGTSTQNSGSVSRATNDIVSSSVSSGASKVLTDILQGTGIIRSADISFANKNDGSQVVDFTRARLQLVGEISELGIVFQYGGDFDLANTNFRADFPLSIIFDQEAFRNLVVQISRTSNAIVNNPRLQNDWEIKLGKRFTF